MTKLCITCKNCLFDEPYNYSEATYGDGSISCGKHKDYSAPIWKQVEFMLWNKFAESCKHYDAAV